MDCNDSDLAAGGLLLIPGTSQLLAGGKTGKLYLVNTPILARSKPTTRERRRRLWFESKLSLRTRQLAPTARESILTDISSYEIFGTSAYFNGSVYLGVTPTSANTPAGIGQFKYSGTLTPGKPIPLPASRKTPAARRPSSRPTERKRNSVDDRHRTTPPKSPRPRPTRLSVPMTRKIYPMSCTTAE
jgi:hypothetical protein